MFPSVQISCILPHTYIVFDPAAHTDPKAIFRRNATPEPLLLNGLHFFILFWGRGLRWE